MVISPEVLLLLRIVFAILGFLFFHMKLRIALSMSLKNCVGILMGGCIDSVDGVQQDGHPTKGQMGSIQSRQNPNTTLQRHGKSNSQIHLERQKPQNSENNT